MVGLWPRRQRRNRHGWDRSRRFGLEGHAERDVEFVFAQFVDMYARPSAKLVPVGSREAFDGLLEEGAGFASFAAGEIGQVPSDPDIAAIPDLASYTPVLAGESGAFRLRRHGRGRGVAVLPAHDPPWHARPCP